MSTARMKVLVAVVVFCMTIGLATTAFAASPPAYGSYVPWSNVATLPGQGSSPHGGYATTTVKCQVCHAVHGAAVTASSGLDPEILLPDAVAEACNYCHVGGAGGYIQVYGGIPSNYSGTDLPNAHNVWNNGVSVDGVTCGKCHQVHGAAAQMTHNAYLTTKILRVGAGPDFNEFAPNFDPIAREPRSTDDSATALTKWCAGCHFTRGTYPYYANDYLMQSHIMTTATATYGNPSGSYTAKVAWKNSTYCSSCHSSGFGTAAWPHFTQGEGFLESASGATATASGAADAREDGVCLRCHRSGPSGVGMQY